MLSLASALPAFAPAGALRAPAALPRFDAPQMVKSEALPFLEKPAHLDGTYAGDVVRPAAWMWDPCDRPGFQRRVTGGRLSASPLPAGL